jgi:toxin ParE1/3/4
MSGSFTIRATANRDLENIYRYSTENFGLSRAEAYLREMASIFQLLADSPGLGRDSGHVRAGLYSYICGSHVIYYALVAQGIDIYRILHKSMDSPRHL